MTTKTNIKGESMRKIAVFLIIVLAVSVSFSQNVTLSTVKVDTLKSQIQQNIEKLTAQKKQIEEQIVYLQGAIQGLNAAVVDTSLRFDDKKKK